MKNLFSSLLRPAVTLAAVAIAAIVGYALWDYYVDAPWTRDGRVRADVVAVAPDVPGLVTEVQVKDNQNIHRGDLLFKLDPERFRLALRQAEAMVASRKAAAEQAEADYKRYSKLSDAAVTEQQLELAHSTWLEAAAAYDQALADRDLAKLNLARSEVHASVSGRITNMELQPGTYVTVGRGVMALIVEKSVHVEGYFEETKLPRIHVGDKARIRMLGQNDALTGHVESVAGGIDDRERDDSASLLANVNPTFSWVRLAQRVPVRIALDSRPSNVELVVGRTATVEIEPTK